MKNYIILRAGIREHYFISPTGGIYSHSLKNGFWTQPELIEGTACRNFGLYKDKHECVHIVSCDRSNNIIYTLIHGERISHHTILAGKPKLIVSDFQISAQNGFLNLFYVARIGNDKFLIHCILGNNSQPSILSEINPKDYFLHSGRVYFTNENSTLGYCSYSDGRPSDFVALFKNSCSPYIDGGDKNRHMVWKCGDDILLDGTCIVSDKNAIRPIIVNNGSLSVMWESGDIVHYVTMDHSLTQPGAVMRFISSGKLPDFFCVQNYDEIRYFYGSHFGNEVNIFGKTDIFEHRPETNPTQSSNDIQRLKIMVDMMQKEINGIKNHINLIRQITNNK